MIKVSTQSTSFTAEPSSGKGNLEPEIEVRRIIQDIIPGEELPPTRSLHLYHVRGVGNDKFTGGEDKDVVIYGPEFVYVLDVGYPALPGVVLGMNVSGLGDPHFPDFSQHIVRTLTEETPRKVLFPAVVGRLLVGVKEGTDEQTVQDGLAPYASSVKKLAPGLDIYLAEVKPFREPDIERQIEQNVSFVRYAQMDGVVRFVDFLPGWFVDRTC